VRYNKEVKIKPIILYAVVNKKSPKLHFLELYDHRDLKLGRDEKIIEVEVKEKKWPMDYLPLNRNCS